MHRKPEQAAVITVTGATPAPGDLIADSVDELAAQMRATTRTSSQPAPTAPAWTRPP
jgi:hypothetical protein